MEEREYKLIFNPGIARRLLKLGLNIVDIKPDKANSDKSIFVYKRTPEFEAAFAQINKEIAEGKAKEAE